MDQGSANRAASAEAAIAKRHLKRIWNLPGTQLGVVSWPPTTHDGEFRTWHYWWQAHLLDCLVDAQVRDPQPDRITKITRQIRSHRLRNNGSWVNNYYDDMAWLALALERAGRLAGEERPNALKKLSEQFLNAWVPEDGGGIPWRKQDQFFNAPANGPAGIFLARYGDRLRRAQQMSDWIDETLIDPETHLVFDGIKAGSLVRAQYTYCQGAVIGLDVELLKQPVAQLHLRDSSAKSDPLRLTTGKDRPQVGDGPQYRYHLIQIGRLFCGMDEVDDLHDFLRISRNRVDPGLLPAVFIVCRYIHLAYQP